MSKVVKIRLYRVQDYDLFTLYYDKKFRLGRMMVDAVSAYANGRSLPVFSLKGVSPLPKPEKTPDGGKTRTGTKFTITTSISIPDDDAKTGELIDYLMERNLANSFIKAILRRCFIDVEAMYIDEPDWERFKDPGNAYAIKDVPLRQEKGSVVKQPAKRQSHQPEQKENYFNAAKEKPGPINTKPSGFGPKETVESHNPKGSVDFGNSEQKKNSHTSARVNTNSFGKDIFSMADSQTY